MLWVIEACCVAIFTLEFVVRLVCCNNVKSFIKSPLNIIDLMTIVPFYVEWILSLATSGHEGTSIDSFLVFRGIRMVRVVRVFKVSKYFENLQLVWLTLALSKDALFCLCFLLCICLLLFGAFVYYAELNDSIFNTEKELWERPNVDGALVVSKFQSIPHSFWWVAVTMTTVCVLLRKNGGATEGHGVHAVEKKGFPCNQLHFLSTLIPSPLMSGRDIGFLGKGGRGHPGVIHSLPFRWVTATMCLSTFGARWWHPCVC